MHPFPPIQSHQGLFSAKVLANKKAGRLQIISLMWSCNTTSRISSSHATMRKANGPPKHTASPKRNDRGCWNQSRPLLYTCQSACNQEGSSPSILLMWNCNTSGISSSHATMRQANGPKHIANPKRKDQGGCWHQSIPLLFTCGSTTQTRRKFAILHVHEELQYIWQFHTAMRPCGRQTKTHFQLQTKGPRLLKPINASSLCMPKCPQTRI